MFSLFARGVFDTHYECQFSRRKKFKQGCESVYHDVLKQKRTEKGGGALVLLRFSEM